MTLEKKVRIALVVICFVFAILPAITAIQWYGEHIQPNTSANETVSPFVVIDVLPPPTTNDYIYFGFICFLVIMYIILALSVWHRSKWSYILAGVMLLALIISSINSPHYIADTSNTHNFLTQFWQQYILFYLPVTIVVITLLFNNRRDTRFQH